MTRTAQGGPLHGLRWRGHGRLCRPIPRWDPVRRARHPGQPDAVLATLWNPLPPGTRPLTYTIHYRLLGLFPKTETFSYTWDTGEGTVPEGPGRPPAALRALLAEGGGKEVPPFAPPPPLWAGGLFVKRRVFPCLPGRFVA